jgi:hypothetical protein
LKKYKDSLQDLLQLLRLEPSNTAAKKEMDLVKGLYKQEYDQIKSHTPAADKAPAPKTEKQRKRMKIVEVDEDSDEDSSVQKKASPAQFKAQGWCHFFFWKRLVYSISVEIRFFVV